jgi:hypothetical protein
MKGTTFKVQGTVHSIAPDDNPGSDNYHQGVMMKVRKMVGGGAIVALSIGLVSLGTGLGAAANHEYAGKKPTSSNAINDTAADL